jgi:hypothetical protein
MLPPHPPLNQKKPTPKVVRAAGAAATHDEPTGGQPYRKSRARIRSGTVALKAQLRVIERV